MSLPTIPTVVPHGNYLLHLLDEDEDEDEDDEGHVAGNESPMSLQDVKQKEKEEKNSDTNNQEASTTATAVTSDADEKNDENISKICNDDSSSMVRSGTANEEALTTNNEAIFSAVKTLIEKSEKNILDAIASAKRSLQYDFNKKIGQLTNNLNIKYGLANIHTIDVMSDVIGLGISIPITNSDGFIEFDSNLTENKEKLDILKKFILVKVEAAGHFKKAIGSAMSSLINKDVQLKYNAKGKMINGTCKKKFSSTNLYKIIEGN
ncbi:hypothetical protein PV325_004598 [Microctonus aethiopoides]|nr:hypothetical protein PV325_004598 [Microctonus aethiopoides]